VNKNNKTNYNIYEIRTTYRSENLHLVKNILCTYNIRTYSCLNCSVQKEKKTKIVTHVKHSSIVKGRCSIAFVINTLL